jgi:hypothetical protein
MTEVVSCRSFTTETQVRSQAILCEICGVQFDTGMGFSPNASVVLCHYRVSFIDHGDCVALAGESFFQQHISLFLTVNMNAIVICDCVLNQFLSNPLH